MSDTRRAIDELLESVGCEARRGRGEDRHAKWAGGLDVNPTGLQIPDSIEPYIGYKALNITPDGQLCSPSKHTAWPLRRRLGAHCTKLSHWTWVPVEGEPPPARWTPLHHPKPNNPLPPGWNWSWEPLGHDSPEESCHCGIYVVAKPEDAIAYLGSEGVIAEIALWGKVIPAHRGARGQYAYPQKLLEVSESAIGHLVNLAATRYRIPVEVLDLPEPEPAQAAAPPVIQPTPGAILQSLQSLQGEAAKRKP